jgi:hypothetical protein
LSGVLGVALFLLRAATIDAVAPVVPPYDDVPWLAFNLPEVPSGAFEDATGMTQEGVISQFGPPIRVRRDADLPNGCIQSYVYVTRVLGERTTTGLCFNAQGRVASFLGQTVTVDLSSMADDSRDTFVTTGVMSLLVALPMAGVLTAWRRARPLQFAQLPLKDPLMPRK